MRFKSFLATTVLSTLLLMNGRELKAEGPELAWKREEASVALVRGGEHIVWKFNYAATQQKPFFHPVALPDSPALSWLAPPDHVWHYGMWFAWKYLNGKIYWEFDPKTGRAEGIEKWSKPKITTRKDFSARIEMDVVYHAQDDLKPVLKEKRTVEIGAPQEDGAYHFDWTLAVTAPDSAVEFQRTPVPGQPQGVAWGGYAGLNFRFSRDFKDWKAVNAKGDQDMKGHGVPSLGCDFNGEIGGKVAGVAMVDHPQNRVSPTPWYLAMNKKTPMACLLAAPIFQRGFTIQANETFTLRYRVIVHPQRWDSERLRREHRRYAKDPLDS